MTERYSLGAGATYEGAGVSIAAGDAAVDLMRPFTERARRPEVMGAIGGFASLFRLPPDRYKDPVLASASDGVGTKSVIAQAMDKHDTIGIDLVAMVVDDLVVCGAEPLFLQDYIACGKVDPERIATIVAGIAEGCVQANCALVGGETAEHPGVMGDRDYDLASTAVGVVEAEAILDPTLVRPGDKILGMASSGLHSNGFSLVRHVLLDIARMPLEGHVEEFGRSLGEELLQPCRIYALDCLALIREAQVHALAHITGGGLAGNLARVIPDGLTAVLNRGFWTPAPVFGYIAGHGRVCLEEMEKAFNMGIGMVAVIAPDDYDRAMALLTARHLPTWHIGDVVASGDGQGRVELVGEHPRF